MILWNYNEAQSAPQYYLRVDRRKREERQPLRFICESSDNRITYNLFCMEGRNGARKVRVTNAI